MTYSIVGRDARTGALGVAVQSHLFSVGSVVPWAEPGVGAVATQAFTEAAQGPRGLALLREGRIARSGRIDEARADADRATAVTPQLTELLRALPAAGILTAEALGRLLPEEGVPA